MIITTRAIATQGLTWLNTVPTKNRESINNTMYTNILIFKFLFNGYANIQRIFNL